ncbi:MAG: alanine--tRNA ligase, partial [Candidatus Omnitrophota bacterium]
MVMTSGEIRERFLGFFKDKGHIVVESDLLMPRNDPTLLFTGAGMNQFKEQFMGRNITYKRAASCQKCLRTGDIENVGRTPRHHTFFEMLGNFSFGDYFKKEAIRWGWEFMTKELGIPGDLLWVSVYKDDEESYLIWLNDIKVPAGKIVKLGAKDNFWPADAPSKGPNGPCGPCSEIFYDWGKDAGCGAASCSPACDCGRFVEVWNLVFAEFERRPDGTLAPLPNKNIDTGMGLERITSVIQGVRTNFGTDLFKPVVDAIIKEMKDAGHELAAEDAYLMADHIRAVTFSIADGVSPSNEKQGYVIRKLIRRAYLKSGRKGPFLYRLVPKVAALVKDAYPYLSEKHEHISAIVREEEKRFGDTLNAAMPVFEDMISGGDKVLSGERIFKLVDTYGLPIDVITEEAGRKGISLDMEGFDGFMEGRKEQSRRGSDIVSDFIFKPALFNAAPNPPYSDAVPLEASLEYIIKGDKASDRLSEGDCAEIVTSPQSGIFYAEAGGQAGDKGMIAGAGGKMNIVNTREVDGRKVFQVVVSEGCFRLADKVVIESDEAGKKKTACNHTATHLLQASLREVLGDQVKQSGSFVDDRRLRFDFTHIRKLSDRELVKVEDIVNTWIEEKIPVKKEEKTIEAARAEGALSFFGEKYGDVVRVVTVAGRSKEFCGGTHVDNTGDIGVIKITAESSVASGIRRIEALTGGAAKEWIRSGLKGFMEEYEKLAGEARQGIDESILGRVSRIIEGDADIDGKTIGDYEERIKPAFLKAFEALGKDAKKRRKEEEGRVFDEAKKKTDECARHPEVFGRVNFVSAVLEG